MFLHFSECIPLPSSRNEAFHTIILFNDAGGSIKHFTISFHSTVAFYPTSCIILTFSLTVNLFLLNTMAIHFFKIT
jgi:hypothetical protein